MKPDSVKASLVVIALAIFAAIGNLTGSATDSNGVPNAETVFNRANPKMIWGETTNFVTGDPFSSSGNTLKSLPTSLRVGLDVRDGAIILSGQPLRVSSPPEYLYVFTRSIRVWAGVPPFNQAVILSMTDSNSVPVPKTAKGLALGQSPTLKPETMWIHWGMNNRNPWLEVFNTAPCSIMTFGRYTWHTNNERNVRWLGRAIEPTEYFSIKNPGLYKLIVTLRLYVVDTNTYLKPITLPPVTVPVRVEK